MFRCAGSWVTLGAFPPAEFVQSKLLQATFKTLVSRDYFNGWFLMHQQ